MVQKSIMTINTKLDGQRELTIVDLIDNSDNVQSELNAAALLDDLSSEKEDGGDAIVDDDFDCEIREGFQSHECDKSMVLGLMSTINMTLSDDENEDFEEYESFS
jgi:hypothetical protein